MINTGTLTLSMTFLAVLPIDLNEAAIVLLVITIRSASPELARLIIYSSTDLPVAILNEIRFLAPAFLQRFNFSSIIFFARP